jgi:hypothetical protein
MGGGHPNVEDHHLVPRYKENNISLGEVFFD